VTITNTVEKGSSCSRAQLVEQVLPGHLAALEVQLAQHQVEAIGSRGCCALP
jgi:hypothetical protein